MDFLTPGEIFCQLCYEIFSDGLSHNWDQPMHLFQRSRQTLTNAVENRCWLCARLSQTRNNDGSEAADEVLSGSYQFETLIDSYGGLRRLLRIEILGTLKLFEVSVQQGGAKILDMAHKSLAKPWTGDIDVAMLAASWLSECRGKHTTCNTASSSDWHPSRLLKISGNRIRLVLTASENVNEPYATLSHCWGSAEFFVLNSQNIRRFLEGIPMDQIPRTFQETIKIIQKFGINYLWIDCYCIIQGIDSVAQADWARECSRMRKVYSSSLINIGAAHAHGPSEGLFSTRQQTRHCSFAFLLTSNSASPADQYVVTETNTCWSPLERAFLDLYQSPLMQRAWVLQECVLSSRMLSFTRSQMYWQCSELAACETFPMDLVEYDSSWTRDYPFWTLKPHGSSHFTTLASQARIGHMRSRNELRSLEDSWFKTIANYSQATLTYPEKDRFKAIEGIGTAVALITNDTYMYGLLIKTLPQALLWNPSHTFESPSYKNHHYVYPVRNGRAPTWHWASYDCSVSSLSITTLYRGASHTSFYPLASILFADNYGSISPKTSKTVDFWPHLLCISRCLEVTIESIRSSRNARPEFALMANSIRGKNLHIDDVSELQLGQDKATILVPLMIEISLEKNREQGNSNSLRQLKVQKVSALLVRDSGKGTFQRIGTCISFEPDLLSKMFLAKPRLLILE